MEIHIGRLRHSRWTGTFISRGRRKGWKRGWVTVYVCVLGFFITGAWGSRAAGGSS